MLNKSPWAKQGSLIIAGNPGGVLGDLNRPGRTSTPSRGTAPPGSRGAGEPGGVGETGMSGPPQINVLVRWESAAPVREAAHQVVPAEALRYYIVSLSGMPAIGHEPQGFGEAGNELEPRKEETALTRKGKDPIQPERLQSVEQAGRRAVLFFFPREAHPITLEDREVTFATSMGPARLAVRFPLKEMLYQGQLEL